LVDADGRYNIYKDHVTLQDYEINDGMVSTELPSPCPQLGLLIDKSLEMY